MDIATLNHLSYCRRSFFVCLASGILLDFLCPSMYDLKFLFFLFWDACGFEIFLM